MHLSHFFFYNSLFHIFIFAYSTSLPSYSSGFFDPSYFHLIPTTSTMHCSLCRMHRSTDPNPQIHENPSYLQWWIYETKQGNIHRPIDPTKKPSKIQKFKNSQKTDGAHRRDGNQSKGEWTNARWKKRRRGRRRRVKKKKKKMLGSWFRITLYFAELVCTRDFIRREICMCSAFNKSTPWKRTNEWMRWNNYCNVL